MRHTANVSRTRLNSRCRNVTAIPDAVVLVVNEYDP